MNETPDLFGSCIRQALSEPPIVQRGDSIVPRARRDNPHTSVQAAESMVEGAYQHRVKVLTCLVMFGEQTGWEIAAKTGLSYQAVSKRCPELKEQGTIDRIQIGSQDGKPVFKTRPSPSGRPCAIWRVL